ncbi:S-ADENOSYL-L-METHIONINE-DEPENDENT METHYLTRANSFERASES SUPERFAMILY PROTEIN [Salix viminalis]|uniref:S-ADENOSYL-L-METHIONINE-DEPENDENT METHYLTRANSFERASES SUPERFAMILY PROTEIN n=1 Tax=Salix viminalis TaxID=40686 RepID=A0A9Q0QJB3_SALVM|nr:S-ADENOSYL-L-METHIONINE-DEPENDENT METHYLTRANSFERASES SUPERFAMILY PROTEIN [Salix viminalis]
MLKKSSSRSLRCRSGGLLTMLCPLFLLSLLTIVILSSDVSYLHFFDTNTLPHLFFDTNANGISHSPIVLPPSLHSQISNLQTQLGVLLGQLHNESSGSKVDRFSDQVLRVAISVDKLVNSLSSISGNAPAGSGNGNEQGGRRF